MAQTIHSEPHGQHPKHVRIHTGLRVLMICGLLHEYLFVGCRSRHNKMGASPVRSRRLRARPLAPAAEARSQQPAWAGLWRQEDRGLAAILRTRDVPCHVKQTYVSCMHRYMSKTNGKNWSSIGSIRESQIPLKTLACKQPTNQASSHWAFRLLKRVDVVLWRSSGPSNQSTEQPRATGQAADRAPSERTSRQISRPRIVTQLGTTVTRCNLPNSWCLEMSYRCHADVIPNACRRPQKHSGTVVLMS